MKFGIAALLAAKLYEELDDEGNDLPGAVIIVNNENEPEPNPEPQPEPQPQPAAVDLAPIQAQLDSIVSLLSSLAANVNETRLEIMRVQSENYAAASTAMSSGFDDIRNSVDSQIETIRGELATMAQTTPSPEETPAAPVKPVKRWL